MTDLNAQDQVSSADCFEAMKPILDNIMRTIATAPLEPKRRAGLAMKVAAYFWGVAATEFHISMGGKPGEVAAPEFFRTVMDQVIGDLERGGSLSA